MFTVTYNEDPAGDVWAFIYQGDALLFSDSFSTEQDARNTVAILWTVLI